jgi:molybdopterin/thiamine biosynthesis adenylyltransferase
MTNYKRENIIRCVNLLAKHNLIEEGNIMQMTDPDYQIRRPKPQIEFLKDMDMCVDVALKKLREGTVAVFGLGAHGASLVLALANEGIGRIKCLDPSLVSNEDLYLSSWPYQENDIGKRREDVLFHYIENTFPSTTMDITHLQNVSEHDVERCVEGCDFGVCCIDKGFSSMNYWLNRFAQMKSMVLC